MKPPSIRKVFLLAAMSLVAIGIAGILIQENRIVAEFPDGRHKALQRDDLKSIRWKVITPQPVFAKGTPGWIKLLWKIEKPFKEFVDGGDGKTFYPAKEALETCANWMEKPVLISTNLVNCTNNACPNFAEVFCVFGETNSIASGAVTAERWVNNVFEGLRSNGVTHVHRQHITNVVSEQNVEPEMATFSCIVIRTKEDIRIVSLEEFDSAIKKQ
jgi:hypothetical protein